ncbi:class I SAM-dependent methyltransferase [Acidipropionibacterium virtanenii]|uniref:Demethylmenaquinone methyltransferase n=1 Tax=Acidipropionibacterium virtanenii TaxID=2057246 RepID=A0A344UW91_9ACTN|nr:methyltransferase domain-containing protein [Acidipropionibacterium virtanenii]AXE39539.1 Demethylmenaquinone methyltransferase [Acidipropionibacterium virtanenii]
MDLSSAREAARRIGLGAREDPWPDYLARFHEERPGVIQEVIGRCRAGQRNPYAWLARSVSRTAGVVVDVCCGAGALSREIANGQRLVIGVERNDSELGLAEHGGGQIEWVHGSEDALPLADSSVDAVVTSMGMVTTPDPRVLVAEASRVLRPGGVFACMAPTVRPVPVSMLRTVLELTARVGSTPSFPGALELRMNDLLAECGLHKVEDARSCYTYSVSGISDADLLIGAMYLPGSTRARRRSARNWLVRRAAGRGPVDIAVPMRRVVAQKEAGPASGIA